MVKKNIILLIAYFLILSGCVSTIETVGEEDLIPKAAVGMLKAEVLKTLSRPDFTWSSEDQTIFFYCTDLMKEASKGTCTPIFFKDDKVVAVGEKDSQRWDLDLVLWKVKEDKKKKPVKKEREAKPSGGAAEKTVYTLKPSTLKEGDTKPSEDIAEETLYAQKTYTPKEGDTVYVNYHMNFVRYIPLRSNPSNNGKILKTICIGSELSVVTVQDRWLYVEGVDENFTGWVLKNWVTNDRTVKIDAEKRRKERAPEISRLEAIVKPIPQSKWKDNLRLYEMLLTLDPCNSYYQRKVEFYEYYGRKTKRPRKK